MKITVFTSNQLRHIALIKKLSTVVDEIFVIQECVTVYPGRSEDHYKRTPVMRRYFDRVIAAEREIFGELSFMPCNVKTLPIRMGDLNKEVIPRMALESDFYVVYGSSFIKGALIDFLISNQAMNLHMGISPFYRGSDCNFWALYDGNTEHVGATGHLLSRDVDSGDILFHVFPDPNPDPFLFTMGAVKRGQELLVHAISEGGIFTPIKQNRDLEIRHSRYEDFTDEVAEEFLNRIGR